MQRKFLSNLLILQLLNWLIKPVWIFWIEVKVQNTLQDATYGAYYSVFGLALLFNILLDFGLNNYVASRVAADGNHQLPSNVLRLRMWLAALYVILVAVLGLVQHMDPLILSLVLINQLLAGFTLFYRAVLQGRHLFRTDSLASVADRLVAILLLGGWIISGTFDAANGLVIFLGAQTAGYLTALLFSWYYARKGVVTESAEGVSLKPLMSSTAWFAVLAFSMAVFTRIDTQMLRSMAGDEAVGHYARSFRFLDAALIFSTLISSQLLPLFSGMINRQQQTDGLVWLTARIVLFVALPLAGLAAYFSGPVLSTFYPFIPASLSAMSKEHQVFHYLMLSFIPMAIVHVFGTWLTAAGKLKYLSMAAIGCMLVNIGLNYVLIPELGAAGTALSCLITQTVFALLCIWGTVYRGGFELTWVRFFKLVVWVSATEFIFGLWHRQGSDWLMMAAAGGTWLLAAALSGMFWPELKKFIQRGS